MEVDVAFQKSTRSNPSGNCVEVDREYKKSTRSGSSGNCVEVGAKWTKSTRTGHADCVEFTTDTTDETVAMRDSKDPTGPVLEFSVGSWTNFINTVKTGQFDLPA